MPVVLARVDDRLIHGQVVQGWVPHVHADSIYVVSEDICDDQARCRLMRMIVPPHLKLRITAVDALNELLAEDRDRAVLLLFATLSDVLAAVKAGLALSSVNVGNLHHLRGGKRITPCVFLDQKDMGLLRELFTLGIDVVARDVPGGQSYDLLDLIGDQEP